MFGLGKPQESAPETAPENPPEATPSDSGVAPDSPSENPSESSSENQMPPEASSPEATPSEPPAGAEAPASSTSSEPAQTGEPNTSIARSGFDFSGIFNWADRKILLFLDIADIACPHRRRGAFVALGMDEAAIKERLDLARAFFCIELAYGTDNGMPDMVHEAKNYLGKIEKMIKWLGM